MTSIDLNQKSRIFVQNRRKDGKFTVLYVFPISDRKIKKILTLEKLLGERERYELIDRSGIVPDTKPKPE